jgi:hypothetical protein
MSPVIKKLAAGASLVALGGITAVAIGQPGRTDSTKSAAAPVEVRTETIKKTVHVTRHEKPKHRRARPATPAIAQRPAPTPPPAPAAPAASAPAYRAPAPAPAPRPVASVRAPVSAPTHHPVTTRTSGGSSGGGGGEERDDRHESEGGDD